MKMQTFVSLVLVALIPLLIFACATSGSAIAGSNPIGTLRPADAKPAVVGGTEAPQQREAAAKSATTSVAGQWSGKWVLGGRSGRVPLRLNQEGSRVWGTYDSPDVPSPYHDVKVEGTLEGNHLVLKIPQFAFGFIDVNVNGDGKTMTGRISGSTNRIAEVGFWRDPE